MPEPAAEPQSGTASARRLVIRVKILPKEPPEAPVQRRLSRGALLLVVGAAVALLSWIGISIFRTDPPPAPVPAHSEAAPVVSGEPLPKPATETAEPEVREQPDAPPSPVNEVIPDVARSAQETIRGTIIVSIRVTLDQEGTVLVATTAERGPSRYFERLALQAAKKWTFTPANSPERRIMLVSFSFKRSGTTARASSLPH